MTIPIRYDYTIDDSFDRSLAFALRRYRALHPIDAAPYLLDRTDSGKPRYKRERRGIRLLRIRGRQYWRAWRYLGRSRQDKTMRCADDRNPGSLQDTAYHELCNWSYGGR